jgi:hypothetical protein
LRSLLTAGIKHEDMPRLGRIVLEHLRLILGEESVKQFLSIAPALRD